MGVVIVVIFSMLVVAFIILNEKYEWFATSQVLDQDAPPENTMPAHYRKTDYHVQMVYVFLAGWLMRKNAQQSREKVQFVHHYLQRNFKLVDIEIGTELTNALKYNTNIRSVSKWVIQRMKDGEERLKLVDFLFEIVAVDGTIIDREFVAIVRFSELIGVRATYIEKKMAEFNEAKFKSYHHSSKSSDALERQKHLTTLNLTNDFTPAQLKRAYRKLVVKYHPDKLNHLPEVDQMAAKAIFLKIQAAYDYLSE